MDALPPLSAPTKGVLALTLLAVVIAALQRILRVDHDPREPPLVPTRIPIFGHVIGLYRHGKRYYQMIEEQYGHDIYTLALPGTKQYVITSPALTAAVSRQSKSISFRPFIIDFTKNAMLFDDEADRINRLNLFDENGTGLITASHDVFYSMLPSGPALDEISQSLLNGVAATFNSLPDSKEPLTIGLTQFAKEIIGFPTVRALWGPHNILDADPTLLSAFWDMDSGQIALGIGVLPWLLARRAYHGRSRLHAAMTAYFESDRWLQASALVQARARAHFAHGYSKKMFAHSDTGLLVGALPNSTFSTFWFLARLLADRALVADIRTELAGAGVVSRVDGSKTAVVDVRALRSRCPLFASAFRETLRLAMPTSSVRAVRRDTLLDGGGGAHLLRGGAACLIEAGVMHARASVWGPDAAEFNPRRFIDGGGVARGVHPAAYRAFGGGEVFCPGRNLALVEVLGIAAPVVMGWEGEGDIGVPEPVDDVMPIGVWKPREDVVVRLRRREGWEDVRLGVNGFRYP
ncbi:cytochrome p450 [Neofusicoccum parvum]|uniref:Cytochrome p450 n=1 Tax=Neofusicoccum parvum TaxID=310453 RepID=A0ACB5S5B0_9PEZI|nr:cytochrome p450 [Neofusicoccum parvum]